MSYSWRVIAAGVAVGCVIGTARASEPIHIGFLWHMHQPIYYPGESITQTDASGHFSFSIADVHNQRFGPYTSWPKDAIQSGLGLPHLGAQVSFSGSLIENLNNLQAAGANGGMWNNWQSSYTQAAQWQTSEGNGRMDLVGFGYHHPLMPLLDERDMRMQIKLHKQVHAQTWGPGVPYSKGIFPAETAFATRMIPALKAEGIEWTLFDSIHLERAVANYPHTNSSNLYAPNKADQVNPALPAEQWVQLNNLWAPSKVAAPFAYRPHKAQHVDPNTGAVERIVAVPAARYEGNEDGRGGFGALQYEQVMEQYRHLNTDPNHPMLVVLHHDGDNFGGGSDAYYHGNFNNMVNWAQANGNYDVTTIQDYLDRYPVAANDVVHIEPGSWAGADNGDPEFKKWLGDPDAGGWSPDRNSWAVLTAAKNRVYTAHDIQLGGPNSFPDMQNVMTNSGSATERAWHYLLQAQASDHWYWDGTEVWDSNVTRGSNLAVAQADSVISGFSGTEGTAPSVFLPQRESYNPGGFEWSEDPEPSDFEVWTFAYDVSGLTSVTLKWRVDNDGENPLETTDNETYAGGDEVGDWQTVQMSSSDVAPPAGILDPTYRALRYGAMITGQEDVLIDYYVEAVDANGNVTKTDIQHVHVGSVVPGGGTNVTIGPDPAVAGEGVTITYDPAGGPLAGASDIYLHYGFDNWANVVAPDPLMSWNAAAGYWDITVPVDIDATLLDIVFNDGLGNWDNNGGADWHFNVVGGVPLPGFEMDGQLDAEAVEVAAAGGLHLYVGLSGDTLYVATDDAGEGNDHFIYLAALPGPLTAANWAKAGQVAQWDALLADENDNDYEGWADAAGAAEAMTGVNGGVLEGTINLTDEFGGVPTELYLAVGVYESHDGGLLLSGAQLPGSTNDDGNLDGVEFYLLKITAGDANFDGEVSLADLNRIGANFGQAGTWTAGDFNGDGQVTLVDLNALGANFGFDHTAAGAAGAPPSVPEPASGVVLVMAWWLRGGRGRPR